MAGRVLLKVLNPKDINVDVSYMKFSIINRRISHFGVDLRQILHVAMRIRREIRNEKNNKNLTLILWNRYPFFNILMIITAICS